MGDLVLVDGGLIKGRLSAAVVRRVQEAYRALEIRVAPGLFVEGGAEEGGAGETWEFDRSEEAAAEAAAAAERAAEKAERLRKRRPAKMAASNSAAASAAAGAELDVDDI
jgi:hypothetical protein